MYLVSTYLLSLLLNTTMLILPAEIKRLVNSLNVCVCVSLSLCVMLVRGWRNMWRVCLFIGYFISVSRSCVHRDVCVKTQVFSTKTLLNRICCTGVVICKSMCAFMPVCICVCAQHLKYVYMIAFINDPLQSQQFPHLLGPFSCFSLSKAIQFLYVCSSAVVFFMHIFKKNLNILKLLAVNVLMHF